MQYLHIEEVIEEEPGYGGPSKFTFDVKVTKCWECYALVLEDDMHQHEYWHDSINYRLSSLEQEN